MVWHFTGRSVAYYESWYGILRVMVRRVSISFSTQRHGDTEESIFIRVNPCNPCKKEWEVTGGRNTLRPYNHAVCKPDTHHGVSLEVMFSTSLLLYSEMRLEFIVTIFSRACISGGYNEDNEILKQAEKGG